MNKADHDSWRHDELLLLLGSHYQGISAKTKEQKRLHHNLYLLNSYVSRWKPVKHRSISSIIDKLRDIESSSEYQILSHIDKEQLINLVKCLEIFLSHNSITVNQPHFIDAVIEGSINEVRHFQRERDYRIIKSKKDSVLREKGKLECEACDFNFTDKYGKRGENYIEVHHTLPLSLYDDEQVTFLEDLALLCSNCHRMIHRNQPWITIKELNEMLNQELVA